VHLWWLQVNMSLLPGEQVVRKVVAYSHVKSGCWFSAWTEVVCSAFRKDTQWLRALVTLGGRIRVLCCLWLM
jgi:hypothetical protein